MATSQNILSPVYRLYYDSDDDVGLCTRLTADEAERDRLVNEGWAVMGRIGYVYTNGDAASTLVPLYRLRHLSPKGSSLGDSVCTANLIERDSFIAAGYSLDGIIGYAFPNNAPGLKPLYRVFNPSNGLHRCIGGQKEYEGLSYGWEGQGIVAYLLASSGPPPTRAENDVIQTAFDFCRMIGVSVSSPGVALYPVPHEDGDEDDDMPDTHWQMRWQVAFGDQATVEVVDATGIVSEFSNSAYYLWQRSWQPAGPLITQAEALKQATLVMQASNQTDELSRPDIELRQDNPHHPCVGDSSWYVTWTRQFKGIPYHNDGPTVIVDAESGEIIMFYLVYPTAPPANALVTISQTQAQKIAQAELITSGIQEVAMTSNTIQVVQPTLFWQNGSVAPLPGRGRVAWVYAFIEPYDRMGEVWVDAQTESVIGGIEYGMRRN